MKLVKIAKLGSRVLEVSLDDNAIVSDALRAAELDSAGQSVRVNDQPATLSDPIANGAVVTLVPQVKGGCPC